MKPWKNPWLWITFVILLSAGILLGMFLGPKLIHPAKESKAPVTAAEKKWQTGKYGEDGMELATPVRLSPTNITIPPGAQAVIASHSSYVSPQDDPNLTIAVNTIHYRPEAGPVNLRAAANGSIAKMKDAPGVADFHYHGKQITICGLPGIMVNGDMTRGREKFVYVTIVFGQGPVLYQIVIAWHFGDDAGKLTAQRILESVKINRTP